MNFFAIRNKATSAAPSDARLAAMRRCLDRAVESDVEAYRDLCHRAYGRLRPEDRRRLDAIARRLPGARG